MWRVIVSTEVRDSADEAIKSYNWAYETEDESLIRRIVEKAPFLGVRRVLLDLEQAGQAEAQARRRQDELAHDMKRFYDAIRLCGADAGEGRVRAPEELVRGVLLGKGIDEEYYRALKARALHAETVYEPPEKPGWLLMMRGIETKR